MTDPRIARKQAPCICPYGTRTSRDYGPERVRLDTTPGCLEHDSCHHHDGMRDAYGVAKWCPVHEAKGCPEVKFGTPSSEPPTTGENGGAS